MGRNLRPPAFSPGAEDWVRVQSTLGNTLDDGDRAEISGIVSRYLENRIREMNDQTYRTAIKQLGSFRDNLHATVDAMKDIYADEAGLELITQFRSLGHELTLPHLAAFLKNLTRASELALANLAQSEEDGIGTLEGDAWQHMIEELVQFTQNRGIRVSTSKGQASSIIKRYSAFVEFVWALQECCPSTFRLHQTGKDGLSSALYDALSLLKKRGPKLGPGHV